jgi:hypothetical protein
MYSLHKYRIAFNIVNTIQCFAQTKQEIRFLQTNPGYSAPSGCPDDAPCMSQGEQGSQASTDSSSPPTPIPSLTWC